MLLRLTVQTDLTNYIHIQVTCKMMNPLHVAFDPNKLEKIMVTVINPDDPNGPFELIQMPLQLVGRDCITDRFSYASIVDSFNHATQNNYDVRIISILNYPDYHVPTKTRAALESDVVEGGSLRSPYPHRVHFLVVKRSM
jgi:hypothetical protein